MSTPLYDLLITGGTLVTMDPQRRVIPGGVLAVQGDRIALVGPGDSLSHSTRLPSPFRGRVGGEVAKKHIDATGKVILPGLVNAHSHLAMTLFRGFVEDLDLQPWLERVWKYELTALDAESVRLGSALALAESIRGGVTCAHDMYWHYEATMDLCEEVGFRLLSGPPITGIGGIDFNEMLANAHRVIQKLQGYRFSIPVLQAHSTYTTTPEMMHAVREVKQQYGIPFTTHASENRSEVAEVTRRFGKTPIHLLDSYGLLGPETVLAHCVVLDEAEIARLAETGTHVAHCPESNLKLGSGIARVAEMLAAGVNVCLGTDGAASNNDLDLLGEARTAALLQKGFYRDPKVLTTHQALEMITINGAKAYGLDDRLGSLEVGKLADLAIVNLDTPHATPLHDIYASLLYSVSKADFDTVVIAGKIQMENKTLLSLDEAALKAGVRRVAEKFV